ncbi:MAG: transporter [Thermoleophilia bacterium]|nr:transporter [Thermoleophilia bacterium]
MTPAILIFIALMWFPTALLILGHGEPQATGLIDLVVGFFVVIGATLQATFYHDVWTAGLLYVHGMLYMTVGYSFITGQTNLRPMGNVSLITGIVTAVYALVWLIGGPDVDGAPLVAQNWSLFIMATIYAILTYEVTLNCYGKLSGKVLAWSLIIAIPISLFIPAFWILVDGKLPF